MTRAYDLRASYGQNMGMTCIGPECDKQAVVHFMCNSHYYQKRRGNPLTPITYTTNPAKKAQEGPSEPRQNRAGIRGGSDHSKSPEGVSGGDS